MRLQAEIIRKPSGRDLGVVFPGDKPMGLVFAWSQDSGNWDPYGVLTLDPAEDIEMRPFPPCFRPTQEVLDALNAAKEATCD